MLLLISITNKKRLARTLSWERVIYILLFSSLRAFRASALVNQNNIECQQVMQTARGQILRDYPLVDRVSPRKCLELARRNTVKTTGIPLDNRREFIVFLFSNLHTLTPGLAICRILINLFSAPSGHGAQSNHAPSLKPICTVLGASMHHPWKQYAPSLRFPVRKVSRHPVYFSVQKHHFFLRIR